MNSIFLMTRTPFLAKVFRTPFSVSSVSIIFYSNLAIALIHLAALCDHPKHDEFTRGTKSATSGFALPSITLSSKRKNLCRRIIRGKAKTVPSTGWIVI